MKEYGKAYADANCTDDLLSLHLWQVVRLLQENRLWSLFHNKSNKVCELDVRCPQF